MSFLFQRWRYSNMKVTADGVTTELKHGESLLDAVKKLEMDSISLRKRPLAAQIGGEVFSLRYTPFKDVEVMNETIISNWNNTVRQDDIVFHLGDFCLGGSAEWTKILDRLNGKIYLIMGNHDLKNIRQGYIDRFEYVAMQMRIEIGKQRIYLNHYPFLCFDGGYKDVWQLFGHVHTRKNNTGIDAARLQYLYPTQYDVGVDNNNFSPVSFQQVKRIIENQVGQFNKNK